jgi:gluconate kinase
MDDEAPMMMEEAPMMMEGPAAGEETVEDPLKVLAVLASHDDDFQPWDKIITSKAFSDNENAKKYEIKSTTYEKFLDGKMKDDFDCVLLVFMGAVSSDDLEMKQDYYDHYTNVPIVHYSFAKLKQDKEEMKGVKDYLHKSIDKKLLKGKALIFDDLTNTEECVGSLYSDLEELLEKKNSIFTNFVEPSYNKFDKDGNGTIDL